uniref:Uncharacterized protein n=1 Tax=Anguilla anguilla TaxID=7936 RepID=A0A0E9T1Q4_ANGAN
MLIVNIHQATGYGPFQTTLYNNEDPYLWDLGD